MHSETLPSEDLFKCQNCGVCCKGYGGTYITPSDLETMAVHLGIAAGEFKQRYCTTSGGRTIIKQRSDGYCILWDQGCTVHPVKPRMCRAWPFIENLLRDIENWRIMAANCPGIRMDAAPDAIRACVRQTLAADQPP